MVCMKRVFFLSNKQILCITKEKYIKIYKIMSLYKNVEWITAIRNVTDFFLGGRIIGDFSVFSKHIPVIVLFLCSEYHY